MNRRKFLTLVSSTVGVIGGNALSHSQPPAAPDQASRKTREELATAHTEDKLKQTGLVVYPDPPPAKPTAVVWVHGATANFYYPTYVAIARALAALGHTVILGNTRMHDIGCVLAENSDGSVQRGGSLWGLPSKEVLDIAAWIGVAESRGHSSVVLVGHSAGGPAVRRYMAERTDPRVVGWGQGSVGLALWPPRPSSDRLKVANNLVNSGHAQDFLPDLRLSAQTFLDYAQTPEDIYDFYGMETSNPAVARVRTPLLAFFGTENDVGGEADLSRLRSLIAKSRGGPSRIDTAMIDGADHDYAGKGEEVAQLIAKWIGGLQPPHRAGS